MSALYPGFLQSILEAFFLGNQPTDEITIMVQPMKADYVFASTHLRLSDLGGHIMGTPVALTGITLDDGIFDADNVALEGLGIGDVVEAVVLYAKWLTGDRLMIYIDSGSTDSLPLTLRSGAALVEWNPQGVFKI